MDSRHGHLSLPLRVASARARARRRCAPLIGRHIQQPVAHDGGGPAMVEGARRCRAHEGGGRKRRRVQSGVGRITLAGGSG